MGNLGFTELVLLLVGVFYTLLPAYFAWKICDRAMLPRWFALLTLIPGLGLLIFLGILSEDLPDLRNDGNGR